MKNVFQPMKTHSRTLRRSGAFTLVELLVVVTVVIILAALSIVATRAVRQKARQANAVGSLRQLGAAGVAYSLENNGEINTLRWNTDPKEGRPFVANSFWGRMQPHLFGDSNAGGNQKALQKELKQQIGALFSSPDPDTMAGTVLQGAKIYHDNSGLPVPVSFNKYLYPFGDWANVNRIDRPAEVLYFAYGFGMFDEADGKEYAETPTNGMTPGNNFYYLSDRRAWAAFLDGHVEGVSAPMPDRRFARPD